MKYSFSQASGFSIIEIIVSLFVLTLGIVGTFQILTSSQTLARTTEHRVIAINLAREGMEAMENIRNTNWQKFPANKDTCWKTFNYDTTCITLPTNIPASDILNPDESYVLVQADNSWHLLESTNTNVYFDTNGLSIQTDTSTEDLESSSSGIPQEWKDRHALKCDLLSLTSSSNVKPQVDCRTRYQRYIEISHPEHVPDSEFENCTAQTCMLVRTVVSWREIDINKPREVSFETVYRNWKEDL